MSQFSPMGSSGNVRPHRGAMILVFAILSWVLCFVFGIVAWIMGNSDLQAMERGEMDRSGEGLTKAGKIIGMVHVIVCIIAIPLMIFLVLIGAFATAAGAGATGAGP